MKNVENFDHYGRTKPYIDSPRSLLACERQGISPEELIIKTVVDMKKLYKDGMNDKRSLDLKLQHYEIRRRKKIQLLIQERQRIIRSPPHVKSRPHDRYNEPIIREVEDKLEKKKIMDEVKAEIKRKQIEIKDQATQNKIKQLNKQREQQKMKKKQQFAEKQYRKNTNLLHEDIRKTAKINNWMETKEQKEYRLNQIEQEKKRMREMNKKNKEDYYQNKTHYVSTLHNHVQNQKQKKFMTKQEQNIKRLEQQNQFKEIEKQARAQQMKKNQEWKEVKKKQVSLNEQKHKQQVWQTINKKDNKKDDVLRQLEGKRKYEKQIKQTDKEHKEFLVKKKFEEDEYERQKRRLISEMRDKIWKQEEQAKLRSKKNEQLERQRMNEQKERQMKDMLEEEQKNKRAHYQFILAREEEKQSQIEEKKRYKKQQEQEKKLLKRLKEQEIEENYKRKQLVKDYENKEKLDQKNAKMRQIQQQKAKQKRLTITKGVSRDKIQAEYASEVQIGEKKSKTMYKENKQNYNNTKTGSAKKHESHRETKDKMKSQEVRRLIENLKIQCNKEQFAMMQEQEKVEKERQQLEKTAQNITELRRLQKIHAVERARFQESLNKFIRQNQEKVNKYKNQFQNDL